MRARPLAVAIAAGVIGLGGCTLLYSPPAGEGDGGSAADGAVVDAAPHDAAPGADADCFETSQTFAAVADATLIGTAPATKSGGSDVVAVDSQNQAVGIFRFDLRALPAGARLVAAAVRFPYADLAAACVTPPGSSCVACAGHEVEGPVDLYAMRSDWEEAEVTYSQPAEGGAWELTGANGTGDRSSAPIGSATHQPSQATVVVVSDLSELLSWRSGDDLSVLLATESATFMIRSRENGCVEPPDVATLQLWSCE